MKGLKTPLLVLAATVALLAALPFGYQVVTGQPIGANTLLLTDAASGSAPAVRANGQDANISINVVPKGTGTLLLSGVPIPGVSGGAGVFTTITASGLVTQNGGEVTLQTAPSGVTATLKSGPIRVFHNFTDQATTGTALQTLYTYTLPANVLNTVGQSLHIQAEAVVAANANNKNWQITFGATTLYSTAAVAFNNVNIRIDCNLFLTAASAQKSLCQTIATTAAGGVSLTVNAGSLLTTPAENNAAPIVINFQGTTPTAAGDLTARYAFVDMWPNGQ
jgi:hypothetical protein